MTEEVEGLEYHSHLFSDFIEVASALCDVLTINDNAAAGRFTEHVDTSKECRFTSSRRSDYGNDVTIVDGYVNILERDCFIIELFS